MQGKAIEAQAAHQAPKPAGWARIVFELVALCGVALALGVGCGHAGKPNPAERAQEVANEPAPAEPAVPDAAPDESAPDTAPGPEPAGKEPIGPPPPIADGVEVRVTHVTDGDTLYAVTQTGAWAHQMRLGGVNAPECKKTRVGSFMACVADDEFYGLEAYKELKKLVATQGGAKLKISCKMSGSECEKGDFGRFLVYLQHPDGYDVAEKLIAAGAAWSYTKFASDKRASYCKAEAAAIRGKLGMWKQGRPSVKNGMSTTTKNWYYARGSSSHDALCSAVMGESFAQAAGE